MGIHSFRHKFWCNLNPSPEHSGQVLLRHKKLHREPRNKLKSTF